MSSVIFVTVRLRFAKFRLLKCLHFSIVSNVLGVLTMIEKHTHLASSTKISSLIPKRGNDNGKWNEKHKNKITQARPKTNRLV